MTQYVLKFYTFFHKKDCAPYSNALGRMEIKFWPSRYFNIWTSTGRMATKLGGYKHHLTWTYFTHFDRLEWRHRDVIMILQYLEQIAVNKLFSKCFSLFVTGSNSGVSGCMWLLFLWVRVGVAFLRVGVGDCDFFGWERMVMIFLGCVRVDVTFFCRFFRCKSVGVDGYTIYKNSMWTLHNSNDFSSLVKVRVMQSLLL